MSDPVDLSDTIEDLAGAPLKVEADGHKIEEQRLSDVLDADRYLAQKSAAGKKTSGLRFVKLSPPGA